MINYRLPNQISGRQSRLIGNSNYGEAVGNLERLNAAWLARFLALAGIATLLPFFIHQPWITGPMINAVLILALFLSGLRSAIVISFLPSLMALAGGLLPVVLAPAVPFIIIGNLVFVLVSNYFYQKSRSEVQGYWAGVLSGAFLKFVLLFFSINLLATFFISTPVVVIIEKMLGWSQLATAIAGGVIAWGILKFLQEFK